MSTTYRLTSGSRTGEATVTKVVTRYGLGTQYTVKATSTLGSTAYATVEHADGIWWLSPEPYLGNQTRHATLRDAVHAVIRTAAIEDEAIESESFGAVVNEDGTPTEATLAMFGIVGTVGEPLTRQQQALRDRLSEAEPKRWHVLILWADNGWIDERTEHAWDLPNRLSLPRETWSEVPFGNGAPWTSRYVNHRGDVLVITKPGGTLD